MSQSWHPLTICLIYDPYLNAASWVTPAQATRITNAFQHVEQIEENHPFYLDYAFLAGKKPEVFVSE